MNEPDRGTATDVGPGLWLRRSPAAACFGLLLLASLCRSAVGAGNYPAWWQEQNVLTNTAATNDFAVLNAGRLKWMATRACAEFNAHLPGGAGSNVQTLVQGFQNTNNYRAVNVGQLKNVAKPFYDRLIEAGYTNAYPWLVPGSNDFAAANVGQLKYVFSFDPAADADGDGMSDMWEACRLGGTNAAPTDDPDGDGYLNIYEYLHGGNPTNATSIPTATRYVSLVGSNTAPYASWDTAARNIQDALDAATNEHEIVAVADGVYTGAFNKNLDYGGKAVMLTSANGAQNCIIDCAYAGRGVLFGSGEKRDSVFAMLTVRNGRASSYPYNSYGGAVLCSGSSSPSFLGCVFADNAVGEGGGGAFMCIDSSPLIRGCLFTHNLVECGEFMGGGAIAIDCYSALDVESCVLVGNQVYTCDTNRVGYGSAIMCYGGTVRIDNCTIVANEGGDYVVSYYSPNTFGSNSFMRNCIIWGNFPNNLDAFPLNSVSYCDIQGGWNGGEGNIDADPRLVAESWRLRGNSPGIDAGMSNSLVRDMQGQPRWDDPAHTNTVSIWDIGADEFVDPSLPASFSATISGTTAYLGPQTGAIWVIATATPSRWQTNHVCSSQSPGNYAMTNVPTQVYYWVKAFRDANTNGLCDFWEPQGTYEGNPLYLMTNRSDIAIVLGDPDTDRDGIPDYLEIPLLGINTNITAIDELLPQDDFDGDGVSNADEFRCGTGINDPSSTPPRIGFDPATQFICKSGTNVPTSFAVSLTSVPTAGVVTARVRVAGGTATRGVDYEFADTNLFTLTGSQTSAHFNVTILCNTNATMIQPEKYVVFKLANWNGPAVAGSINTHVLRIGDDEVDSDADGLPDWWEYKYYANLTTVSGTDAWGNTGWTVRQAFIRGVDPNKPLVSDTNDVLRLRLITPATGQDD